MTDKRKPERPKVYLDARDEPMREVALMGTSHYAIRLGKIALNLSVKTAEQMAWAILQRQAKRQKDGR